MQIAESRRQVSTGLVEQNQLVFLRQRPAGFNADDPRLRNMAAGRRRDVLCKYGDGLLTRQLHKPLPGSAL